MFPRSYDPFLRGWIEDPNFPVDVFADKLRDDGLGEVAEWLGWVGPIRWFRERDHEGRRWAFRNGGDWRGTVRMHYKIGVGEPSRWVAEDATPLLARLAELLEEKHEREKVVAKWKDGDQERTAEVLNPGDWYGAVWLLWCEDCYSPPVYAVEAYHFSEAEDIFVELTGSGEIEEPDLVDYGDDVPMTGQGVPYDGGSIRGTECPEGLLYYSPLLPPEGVTPEEYAERHECQGCETVLYTPDDECERCRAEFWREPGGDYAMKLDGAWSAAAIAGLPSSVCYVGRVAVGWEEQCERVDREDVPAEWLRYLEGEQ